MSAGLALPRRERWFVGASLGGLALIAWSYTIYEARRMDATGVCECMRMKMSGPELASWPIATVLPLFLMWAIMMIAMMLPSALPMILTFAGVSRNRQRRGESYISISIFLLGYIAIWSLFSGGGAFLPLWGHCHPVVFLSIVRTNGGLGGGLLFSPAPF